MIRNTLLYHRLWYVKKRNIKRLKVYSCLFAVLIILTALLYYAQVFFIPRLLENVESRTGAFAEDVSRKTVYEEFKGQNVYEDFSFLKKDEKGEITSIQTNMVALDGLSSTIADKIRNRFLDLGNETIEVPLGILLERPALKGSLPIKVSLCGGVEARFKSQLSGTGTGRIKHTIYLQVKTTFKILIPLNERKIEVISDIPFAETVFVGNAPTDVQDKGV
ncbi:MAG: sporulation protein YunB [Clostridiales bacterium]|jgi:sporulation protein YunB|nr:sporulation protein YunB [Eubacteriales bacterium]MDH7566784.1 sporulation protein YunB [Clostridiales bacterium]